MGGKEEGGRGRDEGSGGFGLRSVRAAELSVDRDAFCRPIPYGVLLLLVFAACCSVTKSFEHRVKHALHAASDTSCRAMRWCQRVDFGWLCWRNKSTCDGSRSVTEGKRERTNSSVKRRSNLLQSIR